MHLVPIADDGLWRSSHVRQWCREGFHAHQGANGCGVAERHVRDAFVPPRHALPPVLETYLHTPQVQPGPAEPRAVSSRPIPNALRRTLGPVLMVHARPAAGALCTLRKTQSPPSGLRSCGSAAACAGSSRRRRAACPPLCAESREPPSRPRKRAASGACRRSASTPRSRL